MAKETSATAGERASPSTTATSTKRNAVTSQCSGVKKRGGRLGVPIERGGWALLHKELKPASYRFLAKRKGGMFSPLAHEATRTRKRLSLVSSFFALLTQ